MRSVLFAVAAIALAIPARAQSPSTAETMTATGHIKRVLRGRVDSLADIDYYLSFGETSAARAQWVQLIFVRGNPKGTPETLNGIARREEDVEVSGILLDISTRQPSGEATVTTFLLVRSIKTPGEGLP